MLAEFTEHADEVSGGQLLTLDEQLSEARGQLSRVSSFSTLSVDDEELS